MVRLIDLNVHVRFIKQESPAVNTQPGFFIGPVKHWSAMTESGGVGVKSDRS